MSEDDFLAESAARKILEGAVEPSLRATAVEIVDGAAGNAEAQLASLRACIGSVQTPPFLDPVKLTWWRGVDFLPVGGGKGPSAEVKAALEKFAADLAAHPLPSNQYLIVTAKRLLPTSIFAKTFKTFAEVTVDTSSGGKSKDRAQNALSRLPDLAAAEKLKFDAGADSAFIAKVGADTRTIVSELAKLRTYLGDERSNVTTADVALVCSVGGDEPELWDVTDALALRSPAALLKALSRFDCEKAAILLLTICEKFFRETIVLADALAHGWLLSYGGWAKNIPPDVADDLFAAGLNSAAPLPYPVKMKLRAIQKNPKDATGYSLRELRVARFRLLQARERLVSSSTDGSIVVQELLRVIARPQR